MSEHIKATSVFERELDGQGRRFTAPAGAIDDRVTVQVAGTLSPELADAITAAHGTVLEQSPRWGLMQATLPFSSVLTIAARADVSRVRLPPHPRTN